MLKVELEHLTKAGVLKKVNWSKWAAPTFLIPKKDATIWFISNFCELNKRIKQKPYLILKNSTCYWNSKVSSMLRHLILIWDTTILSCHPLVNVCVL
jgi:hypothetical protein